MTDSTDAALLNARAEALDLALDLEEIAHALQLAAAGRAEPADLTAIREAIDDHGDVVVRGSFDWVLLLRHARSESLRDPASRRRAVALDGDREAL